MNTMRVPIIAYVALALAATAAASSSAAQGLPGSAPSWSKWNPKKQLYDPVFEDYARSVYRARVNVVFDYTGIAGEAPTDYGNGNGSVHDIPVSGLPAAAGPVGTWQAFWATTSQNSLMDGHLWQAAVLTFGTGMNGTHSIMTIGRTAIDMEPTPWKLLGANLAISGGTGAYTGAMGQLSNIRLGETDMTTDAVWMVMKMPPGLL